MAITPDKSTCFIPHNPYGEDKTLLAQHVACDRLGPDPLSSPLLDEFYNLTIWRPLVLTEQYEGSPDALAYDFYGDESLYWVPLLFNGLTSYKQLLTGTYLRMPDRELLFALLSRESRTQPKTVSF